MHRYGLFFVFIQLAQEMNPTDISQFRDQLTDQLAQLRQTAMSHQKDMDENHRCDDLTGADRASELETMEVDSSVAASESNLAKKIEYALKRIDAGNYGVCDGCGGEIPLARLRTKPSVSLCVSCQEKHDAAE